MIKNIYRGFYLFFDGMSKFFSLFSKAVEIIKPRNIFEWIVLLIAIPVPFGVTAMLFYKYIGNNKSKA
ncbi:MAG: hypothetical protein JW702_02470 [Clostridiales bacterium]|nr:hypothetical protein [Clostridiales bacterium]